jgi:hypothetical protein
MDPFVVPTIGFDLLYAFVIVGLGRRELIWINVTTNPTAEWIAGQLTEAFLGMRRRGTSSATGIRFTAQSSHVDCAPWASGTSPPRRPRHGRMALPNGSSDQSGASAWTISLSWVKRIFAKFCEPTLAITMTLERTGPWTKCAGLAPRSAAWNHQFTPDPWRPSSPLFPGLGFRHTHRARHR